ncbi:hypothetical protein OSTOST_02552 [Ostertagia ostertagi]
MCMGPMCVIALSIAARPSTAVDMPSGSHAPPPLARNDTVPVLRSVQILKGIPQDNQHPDEASSSSVYQDDPYHNERDITEDTESDDSDIDVTDILENSTRSTALVVHQISLDLPANSIKQEP